ncbi:hypothetical protein [Pontibacter sp. BAB1700]|uniref:hypothetical protein n=1 Tax=Pontibacter sp. BAB1700 TaxID=1144253 RepID=UPI0012DC5AF5|nr:hypothetical protein [Pontibacter sp. BAB1700]
MENKENDKHAGESQHSDAAKNRPVRVIEDDTTDQEFRAGHIIPGADPPKNEHQRGGFGNRDGKEGFGSDTASEVRQPPASMTSPTTARHRPTTCVPKTKGAVPDHYN